MLKPFFVVIAHMKDKSLLYFCKDHESGYGYVTETPQIHPSLDFYNYWRRRMNTSYMSGIEKLEVQKIVVTPDKTLLWSKLDPLPEKP